MTISGRRKPPVGQIKVIAGIGDVYFCSPGRFTLNGSAQVHSRSAPQVIGSFSVARRTRRSGAW